MSLSAKEKLPYEDEICPIGKQSSGKQFGRINTENLENARKWAVDNAAKKYAVFIDRATKHLAARANGGMTI